LKGQGFGTVIEKNYDGYGISISGSEGSEIERVELSEFMITRNSSDENEAGHLICGSYVDNLIIQNVFVYDAYGYAIALVSSDNNKIVNSIVDTTAAAGQDGIYTAGDGNIIEGNHVANCQNAGIRIMNSGDNIVRGNRCFSNGGSGIILYSHASDNLVNSNHCKNNDYGIYVNGAGCENNVVTGNRATGNTTDNFLDEGTNTTDSGNDWN